MTSAARSGPNLVELAHAKYHGVAVVKADGQNKGD